MHETASSDSTPEESTTNDTEPTDDDTPSAGTWIDEQPVIDAHLPSAVAERMSQFFDESIVTVHDFVSAVRTVVDGTGLTVDELCQATTETPHSAETPDDTYYFLCFYDGIALAHLVDKPVQIRTESPQRTPVEIEASPDGQIDTIPSDAVVSFGVASGEVGPTDTPSPKDAYNAICPYVKAFPTRGAYEQWAGETTVATVAMPLEYGVPIASALTANQR